MLPAISKRTEFLISFLGLWCYRMSRNWQNLQFFFWYKCMLAPSVYCALIVGWRTSTLLIENFWRHQTIMLSCNPHFSCTSTNVFGNHHNWSKVRLTSTSSKYLQTHWVNLEIKCATKKEYSLSSRGINLPCTFYPPLNLNQHFWTVLKLTSHRCKHYFKQ